MGNNINETQNNKFEYLKKLSSLISGKDIADMVNSISSKKSQLESFCRDLKGKSVKQKPAPEKEVVQPKVVEKPVEEKISMAELLAETETKKPVETERKPVRRDYPQDSQKPAYEKKPFDKNARPPFERGARPNFDRNNQNSSFKQRNENGGFNKFGNKPQGPNASQGARPQQKREFTKPGEKPFGTGPKPVKAKPFIKVEETVAIPKTDNRTFGNKNKTKTFDSEKKELNKKAKIKMGYIDVDDNFDLDEDNEIRMGRVRTKPKKQKVVVAPEKTVIDKAVIDTDNLTIKILSEKIGKPAVEIIKKFMMLGMMLNINSSIDFPTAELVASEFGITLEQNISKNFEEKLLEMFDSYANDTEARAPIVTVMGHVDHGKTSLLDAIRNTNVIANESGGITQHIGAYEVETSGGRITFIDTPGHEAFTAMRARGASATDIAILVVAADDGIMPQTVEAIHHIKQANVPMIVAINKIDKPEADIDRIKQQLTQYEVLPEEWGGDTICVPISAKFNKNIDGLLDTVLLVAEMQELKADSTVPASGTVVESKIDKGRGIMATVLVKNGSLHIGDYVVCGTASGRVRAMIDYTGKNITNAGPSTPVSILGLDTVPEAGDIAYVVEEKFARELVAERNAKQRADKIEQGNGVSLEDFLQKSADFEVKTLNILVKADVKGTAEALRMTLEKIKNEEVVVHCIMAAVGGINESDVLLAQASGAIIIGFNTKVEAKAKVLAERNGVQIKFYSVIYDAVDDVTAAISGMLTPKYEEQVIGHVEIRQLFKISSIGTICGSYVLDGSVNRDSNVRLIRNKEVIVDTSVDTLQHNKDQVKTMNAGYECGIKLKNFNDVEVGDILEVYTMKRI